MIPTPLTPSPFAQGGTFTPVTHGEAIGPDDPLAMLGQYQLRVTLKTGLVTYHGPFKSDNGARLVAKETARLEDILQVKVVYHAYWTLARYMGDDVAEYAT